MLQIHICQHFISVPVRLSCISMCLPEDLPLRNIPHLILQTVQNVSFAHLQEIIEHYINTEN